MLNESELIEMRRIAEKAAEQIPHPKGCDCTAQFNRKFSPATCAELVRRLISAEAETKRLREELKQAQKAAEKWYHERY